MSATGTFIFRQFPWVLQLLSPLLPLLKLYVSFPLGSLIVFFGLYAGTVPLPQLCSCTPSSLQ